MGKPEINEEDMGINPFTKKLEIYVYKKEQYVLNKFGKPDIKEFDLEVAKYTKLFDVPGDKKLLSFMPIRSKELYLFIMYSLTSSKDYVWVDKKSYMKTMGINSINTYKTAINGLCDASIIYKHHWIPDVFWINPQYFFKGSRINKYPDNIIIKENQK
jgi:hypothetical protein